jgi:CheY-like chemotaxis protein
MIPGRPLDGKIIMVVEDEFLIAHYLAGCLEDAGARVVGPFGMRKQAETALAAGEPIDAAILDINLAGDLVYPLADALQQAAIPFVFTTGYNENIIPVRFGDVPRLVKPVDLRQIESILAASQA